MRALTGVDSYGVFNINKMREEIEKQYGKKQSSITGFASLEDSDCSEKKYDLVIGVDPEMNKLKESIKIIMKSGLPYEFRTTLVPELHNKNDIKLMGEMIKGAENWFLQPFKSDTKLVNDTFEGASSFTDKEMEEMFQIAKKYVKQCAIR